VASTRDWAAPRLQGNVAVVAGAGRGPRGGIALSVRQDCPSAELIQIHASPVVERQEWDHSLLVLYRAAISI